MLIIAPFNTSLPLAGLIEVFERSVEMVIRQ
jgi:hypothetical protein